MVAALLAAGADPNANDCKSGQTPLIMTVLKCRSKEDVALVSKAAEGCTKLNAIADAVAAHPAVAAWVESRPVTMM